MTKHEALSPTDSLKEEERTENHWVGTAGDLVVLFLYDGAVTDPRHVEVTSRVLQRTSLKLGRTCPFLVVLRSHAGRPPDSSVRSAVRESLEKSNRFVTRAAIVILGDGFAPSIHRGVVTSMYALVGPKVPLTVHSTIAEGLAKLEDPKRASLLPLLEALVKLSEPG